MSYSLAIFISKLYLPLTINPGTKDPSGIYVVTCINGIGRKYLLKVGLSTSFTLGQVFVSLKFLERPKDLDIVFSMSALEDEDHSTLSSAAGNRYHTIQSSLQTAYNQIIEEKRSDFSKHLNKALAGSTRKECEPLCSFLSEFLDTPRLTRLLHDFEHFYSQVRPNPRLYKIFMSRGFHEELTTRINLALHTRATTPEMAEALSQSIAVKTAKFWKDIYLPLDCIDLTGR